MRKLDEIIKGMRLAEGLPGETADAEVEAKDDVCPICGGAKLVRHRLPIDHPDFGRAFPCECVQLEQHGERAARLERYSDLGPLTSRTFDNLSARGRSSNPRDQERFQRCVEEANAFAESPEGWLVLIGPSGCGKTHVAAAIANRCLALGTPPLFVIVPDLLDRLRAAYHPEAAVDYDQAFERVRNAPVLILDDLGGQSSTPWAQEKLFQIINHRFNGRLPTVITSGSSVHKLDDRLQTRLTDPSLSRVFELEPAAGGRRGGRKLNVFDQPRFRNMTFDSFDTQGFHLPVGERRRLEDAYRVALDFAQKPEGWLMLTGPGGSGKTHLAVAITNYRRQLGDSPYFIEASDLLHFLSRKDKKGEPEQYYREVEEISEASLLVLDDLYINRRNPWWEDIFRILKHRHTAQLPTVVTTLQALANLSLDELGERIASLLGDARICSEIRLPGTSQKPRSDTGAIPLEEAPTRRRRRG